MKYSLAISNYLEEISSLSHSVVFLYFFALIAEESFLISPCSSLELSIQMLISFLFSFAFRFPSFHSYLASSDSHFAFLHFFSMGKNFRLYCSWNLLRGPFLKALTMWWWIVILDCTGWTWRPGIQPGSDVCIGRQVLLPLAPAVVSIFLILF